MKPVIIRAQVPDDINEADLRLKIESSKLKDMGKSIPFEIIHRPTDEIIHANAVKYHESMGAGWTGVSFEAGAKWMRDQLFKEEHK